MADMNRYNAGKVFREWVAIPEYDTVRWSELIEGSISFVGGE